MNKLIDKIKTILFYDWDPICINENPYLIDEYDQYALMIENQLRKDLTSIEDIVELLKKIETQNIGLTIDSEQRRKAAQKILKCIEEG